MSSAAKDERRVLLHIVWDERYHEFYEDWWVRAADALGGSSMVVTPSGSVHVDVPALGVVAFHPFGWWRRLHNAREGAAKGTWTPPHRLTQEAWLRRQGVTGVTRVMDLPESLARGAWCGAWDVYPACVQFVQLDNMHMLTLSAGVNKLPWPCSAKELKALPAPAKVPDWVTATHPTFMSFAALTEQTTRIKVWADHTYGRWMLRWTAAATRPDMVQTRGKRSWTVSHHATVISYAQFNTERYMRDLVDAMGVRHRLSVMHIPCIQPRALLDARRAWARECPDAPPHAATFTGSPSPRRRRVVEDLKTRHGTSIEWLNGWGHVRDEKIARQGAALANMAFNSEYSVYESIRCSGWFGILPIVTDTRLRQTWPVDLEAACPSGLVRVPVRPNAQAEAWHVCLQDAGRTSEQWRMDPTSRTDAAVNATFQHRLHRVTWSWRAWIKRWMRGSHDEVPHSHALDVSTKWCDVPPTPYVSDAERVLQWVQATSCPSDVVALTKPLQDDEWDAAKHGRIVLVEWTDVVAPQQWIVETWVPWAQMYCDEHVWCACAPEWMSVRDWENWETARTARPHDDKRVSTQT
jgi:hypothetical protein